MSKLIKRLTVTAAATAAITFGVSNTAYAYSISDYATSSNTCGAVGFSQDGDDFRFLDICRDGKGVRLQYTSPTLGTASTSHTKYTKDYTGGYTGYDYNVAPVFYKDFAEGACFYFRVGHVDEGSYVSGSYGAWQLACA
ncbi:hypothetical protein [Kitasatospora sp. KL5]|uniref:hypothetical protein n=1 Tax=Kitasatospora sp. KL5 TaxID=3425125 RepID=UPI003D6FF90C